MALHIVWNEQTIGQTEGDILVGMRNLFSPREGAVTVPASEQTAIRVIPPRGTEDTEKLAENLADCYHAVLYQASHKGWASIRMPLIGARETRIPRELELRVAADCIREFLDRQSMDIYLVMDDPRSGQILKMLTDVDAYLSQLYPDDEVELPEENEWQEEDLVPLFDLEFDEAEAEEDADVSEMRGILRDMQQKARELGLEEDTPADRGWYWENAGFGSTLPCSSQAEDLEPPPILAGYAEEPNACYSDASCAPSQASYTDELEELLRKADEGFSENLLHRIDLTGKKDSEIYNRANVSRQLFSKIRNDRNYRPTKQTALAFAIALELDLTQTQDLIGRAGYVLNKNSKFDLILTYFINKKWYNVVDINIALLEFDQKLLGG